MNATKKGGLDMKKLPICALTAALCLYLMPSNAMAASLIPVGQVIGLELSNGTVTVAAFEDGLGAAARSAGLQIGDQIIAVDGAPVDDAADIRSALTRSDGQVDLTVLRQEERHELSLCPQITSDGPRLGVHLKQGITGIGTVTWYDPTTHAFGTLGHGVSDSSGKLVQMTAGSAYQARVISIKRGQRGEPGQLRGGMDPSTPIGTLTKNTVQGVFGTADTGWTGTPLPTAAPDQIHPGPATIRSTIDGSTVREYSIEILKLYPTDRTEGRNMLLRVTDPDLLKTTGGIVQGMSGSPIIQDGKLVGAVTHVLVNDPTTGYGIFIDNMLDAAA